MSPEALRDLALEVWVVCVCVGVDLHFCMGVSVFSPTVSYTHTHTLTHTDMQKHIGTQAHMLTHSHTYARTHTHIIREFGNNP